VNKSGTEVFKAIKKEDAPGPAECWGGGIAKSFATTRYPIIKNVPFKNLFKRPIMHNTNSGATKKLKSKY